MLVTAQNETKKKVLKTRQRQTDANFLSRYSSQADEKKLPVWG